VKDIIVCGHSHCGAVKALFDPGATENLPSLKQWLSHAQATKLIIDENYTHLEGDARIAAAVEENVLVQLEALRTHPTVHARLAAGKLNLHGWVYKIETGEVFYYDHADGQFLPLTEAPKAPAARSNHSI
jgi:carbonic anhydrase